MLDFGVSKLTVADAATTGDITLSGNVVGTPEYMAPEQVRAGKHADHRIDIYSLGVVFYEMLAGRPPFVGEHFSGLMLDIMQRDPPPLASLRTDVPRRLAGVIHRALARELDRRYADMQTFIMAVEAVGRDELKLAMGTPAEGLITQIAMPRLTPDGQYPVPKDRRGVAAAIAVGLGVAAGGGVALAGHPARAAPPGGRGAGAGAAAAAAACRRGAQRAGRAGRGRAAGRSRAGGRRGPPSARREAQGQGVRGGGRRGVEADARREHPFRSPGQPDGGRRSRAGDGRGGAGGGPPGAADDRSRQDNEPVEPVESKGASW